MQAYIENISLDTVQQNRESLWHFSRKGLTRNCVLLGVAFIMFLGLYFRKDNWVYLVGALIYVAMIVWELLKPGRFAKKIYNRKLVYYNGTMPPITYAFYDDHFVIADIDSENTATYDKIQSVVILKSCIALKLADGRGFLMSKNGFKKGSVEEFRSFLQEKCPQTNPAKWQW